MDAIKLSALPVWWIVLAGVVPVFYLLRQFLLPKPIQGIPYDHDSSRRLLGDIPDLQKALVQASQLGKFLNERCSKLNSPIIQVWIRPLKRPFVIINDWAVMQDIFHRRTTEFDRAPFHVGFFKSLIPNSFGSMMTSEKYHARKRYLSDMMGASFLRDVCAPIAGVQAAKFIDLWREKMRLANGRQFEATKDIKLLSTDIAWAILYGNDLGACDSQVAALRSAKTASTEQRDGILTFPRVDLPEVVEAYTLLGDSCSWATATPFGPAGHWMALKLIPKYRRAVAIKDKTMRRVVMEAWERVNNATTKNRPNRAFELVMQREISFAEKEGRAPNPLGANLLDESSGMVLAQTDTTGATLTWGVKYLTFHDDIQTKLRDSLTAAFPREAAAGEQIDPKVLTQTHLPYVDAFVEEVLRHSAIVVVLTRAATVDCEVMGHMIPKGTEILFPGDICVRASKSADAKLKPQSPLSVFDPERWLSTNASGEVRYDPNAAPMNSFGAGVRGCFGKKLAYLDLKILFAYFVWNFRFLQTTTANDFTGYDGMAYLPRVLEIKLADSGIVRT